MNQSVNLAQVESLINSWFPPSAAPRIISLLSILPDRTIRDISDLLGENYLNFESISNQRIVFTALRILSRIFFVSSEPLIIRAEIELTHRCNFACKYCRTRLPASYKEKTLSKQEILTLIHCLSLAGCRYIHFNGGEISLLDYVPDLVAEAVACGMKVGVSSNGSGSIKFYRRMVESGVSYLHISFDIVDSVDFERLSSCPGSWSRVTSVLHFLCNEGKTLNPDLFVVANLVLREETLFRLPQTIRYLINIGVDDIKLLPAFSEDANLRELESLFSAAIKPEVDTLLNEICGFDMLKMRLNRLFVSRIHGLDRGTRSKRMLSACEICTEQVMLRRDGVYTPCYIYMRENYKTPDYGMGTVNDDLRTYCENASNALRDKYLSDSTCIAHCPDMIYNANYKAQELVVNCIAEMLKVYDCERGLVVGDIRITYKDLEACFHTPAKPRRPYHVLGIPFIYADQVERVLSVLSRTGLPIERLSNFQSNHPSSKPNDIIRSKIVRIFLSNYQKPYIPFKTKLLKDSELEYVDRELNKVIQLRVIGTHLYFGQTKITSARIPVSPILWYR